MKKCKTWKREISVLMLLFLCYLSFQGQTTELEILVWPFTIFAGASFGQEWASSQGANIIGKRRQPKHEEGM